MTEHKTKHKHLSLRFKWALSVLFVLLLLICSILLNYAHKIEPMVGQRLKETIENATDSLYSITFSDITINPITGGIKLENIHFKSNPDIYRKLKLKDLNPTHLFDISVKSLILKNSHPLKAYFKRELEVKELIINNPSIRVYYQHPRKEDSKTEDKRTAWQRLSKYLNSISIHEIALNNIDFKYIDQSLDKPEIDGVKNLSVKISELLIDSVSHKDKSRFYFTKDISVQVRNHEYFSRDNKYKVLFEEFNVSSSHKDANVKGLRIVPLFKEMSYLPDSKANRSRYNVSLGLLQLNNINIQRLIDRRELRASSLTVANGDFEIFLNRLIKKPEFDRGKNFPQIALRRFRLNTAIDTVKILNTAVTYREYNPATERTGRFFVNSINGRILNLTNDSLLLQKNNLAQSHFNSLLYGKAGLVLNIDFNLTSPRSEFSYNGKITDLNVRHFNLLTRPLALLRIKSGLISEATFSAKADYRKTNGSLLMRYKDLSIGVLKLGDNNIIQKHILLSLVANNLIIKEDNPLAGEPVRSAKISYYRPDSVAFFGMIWKSLYSGIKETIGLTAEREEEIKRQFEGLKPDNEREKKREVRRTKRSDRREQERR